MNYETEKSRVQIMVSKADEIRSKVATLNKQINNLSSATSGKTLDNYINEMFNLYNKLNTAAEDLYYLVKAILSTVDSVYQEEMAAKKTAANLASLSKTKESDTDNFNNTTSKFSNIEKTGEDKSSSKNIKESLLNNKMKSNSQVVKENLLNIKGQ